MTGSAGIRQQKNMRMVLWAWERPEDLSFVDPGTTGIAFLAGTVRITDTGTVMLDPRNQPLSVPDGSKPIAVVRIETDPRSRPGLTVDARLDAASAIIELSNSFKVSEVQIDFDARVSERSFYRDLLQELRKRLPAGVTVSITALASWCMHDTWMNNLPVEEAVPMLFRMGPEGRDIMRALEREGDFREPLCRGSVGISLDEPLSRLPTGKRIYVFSPVSWKQRNAEKVFQEVSRWH